MSWLLSPPLPDQTQPEDISFVDDVELRNHQVDDDGLGGVKDDLSELTETLTRQFWGVASFLAPPPPEDNIKEDDENGQDSTSNSDQEEEEEEVNDDDRDGEPGDEVEEVEYDDGNGQDGDSIEEANGNGGIEDSRVNCDHEEEEEEDKASCYYNSDYEYEDEDEDEDEVIGVTEEALAFANNIGHHPETWLDFPLEEEDEEGFEDFLLSDSQYQHALAIQRLVPTLAALRIELCPVHMSEGYFWMVYFVLLHSRLNKDDAEQLSSSELVQARSMWREELQKRAKLHTDWFDRSTFHLQDNTLSPTIAACEKVDPELLEDSDTRPLSFHTDSAGSRPYSEPTYNETEKQVVECDKAKSAETPSGHSEGDLPTFQSSQIPQDHDSEDDWVQETAEFDGYSTIGMVNEEDVSFSDLEEDSDWTLPIKSK